MNDREESEEVKQPQEQEQHEQHDPAVIKDDDPHLTNFQKGRFGCQFSQALFNAINTKTVNGVQAKQWNLPGPYFTPFLSDGHTK